MFLQPKLTMGIKREMFTNNISGPLGTFKQKAPMNSEQKIVFVTIEDLLQDKKVLYTTLDYEMKLQHQSQSQSVEGSDQDRYKKLMPRKLTLVLEMVDILVKIVDVNSEQLFPLQDQSMHQVAIKKDKGVQEVVSAPYY